MNLERIGGEIMDLKSINEETFKKYKEFSDLNYEKFTINHHYDNE